MANQGFELLPPDDEITVAADLDSAAAAARASGLEGPLTEEDVQVPFGRGWAFDFARGQFRRAGSAPVRVRGLDQLRVWIEKALRTARFAHTIYSDDYGMEQPYEALGQVFTPSMAGRYSKHIEEALLAHDRITAVKDMAFSGGPDNEVLAVSFTVVTDDDELAFSDVPVGTAL